MGGCVRGDATLCGDDPSCPPDTDTDTTDTGEPPGPGVPVHLESSGVITCEDPSLREEQRFDRRLSLYEQESKVWFWGGGVAVGDLTGDGIYDIVMPGFWHTLFYRGLPGGGFIPDLRLRDFDLLAAAGATVVDFDGDGDLDLLITRFLQPDVLLRNDGDHFTDVSAEAGLSDQNIRSIAASWADYDGDGDLDLFIGGYGVIEAGIPHSQFAPADPSFLYVNNGDGTFTDRSADLPQEVHDGFTFTGGFHDLDGDMRPELYVVNDFGVAYPNTLMWNRGDGVLELDNHRSGLDISITGMGLGIGDLNGDEIPDLVMPYWNGISLLQSSDHGIWYETAKVQGLINDNENGQRIAWGADMVDMDNDGDLDIPIAFGWLDSHYVAPEQQADALFIQGDDGTFVDLAPEWGLDDLIVGRGYAAVDLNDDGWLDLVKRDLLGPTRLYLSRCGTEGWLRMRLHAPGANTFAIGARIRLWAGDRRQIRWVHAGGTNFGAGLPPEVHFGLGHVDTIDRVQITWPDGEVTNLFDVDSRQILDVHRLPVRR